MDACKNKEKCEDDDDGNRGEGQDTEEPMKKTRGSCGALQPRISIDGMKMVAEYKIKRKKDETEQQLPEPVERKQILSGEKVMDMLTMQ